MSLFARSQLSFGNQLPLDQSETTNLILARHRGGSCFAASLFIRGATEHPPSLAVTRMQVTEDIIGSVTKAPEADQEPFPRLRRRNPE
jgi:hypothetical protein